MIFLNCSNCSEIPLNSEPVCFHAGEVNETFTCKLHKLRVFVVLSKNEIRGVFTSQQAADLISVNYEESSVVPYEVNKIEGKEYL